MNRMLSVVALGGLGLAVAGCSRSPRAEETVAQSCALLAGGQPGEATKAAARWVEAAPTDPAGHFLLGVCHYFSGDYAAFAAERQRASTAAPGSDALASFPMPPEEKCPPALRSFLRGALAELRGDTTQAAEAYAEAARQDPAQPLFACSAAAARIGAVESVEIPKDQPLAYAGLMSPSAIGNWVPVPDKFTVSGGQVKTAVGECSASATFGGWGVLAAKDGRSVGWAPLATKGELIVPVPGAATAAATPPKEPLEAAVNTVHRPLPFDFGNRFFRVRLGSPEGSAFPVLVLPYVEEGPELQVAASVVTTVGDLLPSSRMGEGSVLALADEVASADDGVKANIRLQANTIFVEETAFLYHRVVEKAVYGAMLVTNGRMVFVGGDLCREVGSGTVFSKKPE
jgi:hypothetical protein